jgi:hypothetical protein
MFCLRQPTMLRRRPCATPQSNRSTGSSYIALFGAPQYRGLRRHRRYRPPPKRAGRVNLLLVWAAAVSGRSDRRPRFCASCNARARHQEYRRQQRRAIVGIGSFALCSAPIAKRNGPRERANRHLQSPANLSRRERRHVEVQGCRIEEPARYKTMTLPTHEFIRPS